MSSREFRISKRPKVRFRRSRGELLRVLRTYFYLIFEAEILVKCWRGLAVILNEEKNEVVQGTAQQRNQCVVVDRSC